MYLFSLIFSVVFSTVSVYLTGNCQAVTCPGERYQASDCKCYCPSGNVNDPVKQCDNGKQVLPHISLTSLT